MYRDLEYREEDRAVVTAYGAVVVPDVTREEAFEIMNISDALDLILSKRQGRQVSIMSSKKNESAPLAYPAKN